MWKQWLRVGVVSGLVLCGGWNVPVRGQQSGEPVGRWQFQISLNGITRTVEIAFKPAPEDAKSNTRGVANVFFSFEGNRSFPIVWKQLTSDTLNVSGEIEFPIGNVGRKTGTLVLKGKFTDPTTLTGDAVLISDIRDGKAPTGFATEVGTFSAKKSNR
ncbi:MAG: hypothetical protein K1Y36_07470 [Blastocatellia bacterium]|nr:hypothetical protein [Blastocatellia bacterium]